MKTQILKELVTKLKESNTGSVEMRVALWDRTSKNGNDYKYARLDVPQEKRDAPKPEPVVDDFEDDIPF